MTQPKRALRGRVNGYVDKLAGMLDCVAIIDKTIDTKDGDTNIVDFQVEADASYIRQEFHHLLGEHEE